MKTDVNEKIMKMEKEIWTELALKTEKTTVNGKFAFIEEEVEKLGQKNNKEVNQVREVCDRMRRKNEAAMHEIIEMRSNIDGKMSAKEGLTLWANFKKYAQYDELK